MTFTWNQTKAKTNINLHHISFELAARVFADPNHCEIYDEGYSTIHEPRYIIIGYINLTPIFVSYWRVESSPFVSE